MSRNRNGIITIRPSAVFLRNRRSMSGDYWPQENARKRKVIEMAPPSLAPENVFAISAFFRGHKCSGLLHRFETAPVPHRKLVVGQETDFHDVHQASQSRQHTRQLRTRG